MRQNLAVKEAFQTPQKTLPDLERAHLEGQYARHDVILEYGCGISTIMAARQNHSLVMAVENDRRWARGIRTTLKRDFPGNRVRIHWVDTGPTMMWGRPNPKKQGENWRNYPTYALSIWDQDFFRHPDLVLIDGRFRTACFLATLFRIERPVTVLFDDYLNRADYHWIERYALPDQEIGRMAQFNLAPRDIPREDLGSIVAAFLEPY